MVSFEMMRFILSLILSCFLFAPLKSTAGDMPVRSECKVKENNHDKNMEQEDGGIDCPAFISPQNQQHNYSTRGEKFSIPNFINEDHSLKFIDGLRKQKYFPQPQLYYKPINLKLLFPKHYFW